MVDVLATLPTHRKLAPGRYGAAKPQPGVSLQAIDRAVATLVAAPAESAAVAAHAAEVFGTGLPTGPRRITAQGVEFIGIGPGRWIALAKAEDDNLVSRLETAFVPHASAVDQSGGLVVFTAHGPRLGDVLRKLLTIDVDPSVFTPGSAATTVTAHIGVTVWRDDTGLWHFAVGYSFEAAFLRTFAQAAAEYGFELQC